MLWFWTGFADCAQTPGRLHQRRGRKLHHLSIVAARGALEEAHRLAIESGRSHHAEIAVILRGAVSSPDGHERSRTGR